MEIVRVGASAADAEAARSALALRLMPPDTVELEPAAENACSVSLGL